MKKCDSPSCARASFPLTFALAAIPAALAQAQDPTVIEEVIVTGVPSGAAFGGRTVPCTAGNPR